jgi:hypothetical protein
VLGVSDRGELSIKENSSTPGGGGLGGGGDGGGGEGGLGGGGLGGGGDGGGGLGGTTDTHKRSINSLVRGDA